MAALPVAVVVGLGAAGVYYGNQLGNQWANTIQGQDGLPAPPMRIVLSHDPGVPPGPDWTWEGGPLGQWHNRKTGESARPDFDHPAPVPPHWDYKPNKKSDKIRIPPGGNPECLGPGH